MTADDTRLIQTELALLAESEKWRIEGYWRRHIDDKTDLPWPIQTPGWGESEFLHKLRRVETIAKRISYRGWSNSRLTGEMNGSREYVHNGWRWPEGLGHYIERGVKPTNDFMAFIRLEAGDD